MRQLVEIAEHTVDVSRLTAGGLVLDVGCRDFSFSRGTAERGCKVVAMDADPTVEDPEIDNVEFCWAALAHKSGPRRFVMSADPQARRLVYGGELVSGEQVDVQAVTLEYMTCRFSNVCVALEPNPKPVWDVVKLDVEGAEYGILREWPGPIATQISVEFHEHVFGRQSDETYEQIISRLEGFGYETVRHERDRRHFCPENFWDSLWVLRG